MNDRRGTPLAERIVRRSQTGQHVSDDRERDGDRHQLTEERSLSQEHIERQAVHVLRHHVELALRLDDVDRPEHVSVRDAGGEARVLDDAPGDVRVGREVRMNALERDGSGEPRELDRSGDMHHPRGLESTASPGV